MKFFRFFSVLESFLRLFENAIFAIWRIFFAVSSGTKFLSCGERSVIFMIAESTFGEG